MAVLLSRELSYSYLSLDGLLSRARARRCAAPRTPRRPPLPSRAAEYDRPPDTRGGRAMTETTQAAKGRAFRALHARAGAFIIPNPWDVGTARILAHLGFEALASTSMGYAFSVGKRDNTAGRDDVLEHAAALAAATQLPVSADLENG